MKILFCGETFPAAPRLLEQFLQVGGIDEIVASPSAALSTALDGVDVVVPLMSRIDAALMDAGRFRLVQQWGAGLDGVDLERPSPEASGSPMCPLRVATPTP